MLGLIAKGHWPTSLEEIAEALGDQVKRSVIVGLSKKNVSEAIGGPRKIEIATGHVVADDEHSILEVAACPGRVILEDRGAAAQSIHRCYGTSRPFNQRIDLKRIKDVLFVRLKKSPIVARQLEVEGFFDLSDVRASVHEA